MNSLFTLAKFRIPTALEAKFAEFAAAMIDTHGRDLTVSTTASAEPSRQGTPAPVLAPSASASTSATSSAKPIKREQKAINTATVTVEGRFMATADDLYDILTNEKRIPMWSRAPATVSHNFEYHIRLISFLICQLLLLV